MVCTTFLHECELNVPTSDGEINTLLAEVRKVTKLDWQVLEHVYYKSRWFRKPLTFKGYTLLLYVGGCGPWQIINFYLEGQERSTRPAPGSPAALIVAYFYGVLAGARST